MAVGLTVARTTWLCTAIKGYVVSMPALYTSNWWDSAKGIACAHPRNTDTPQSERRARAHICVCIRERERQMGAALRNHIAT